MVSQLTTVFAESGTLQTLWGFLAVNGFKSLLLFALVWVALKLLRGLPAEARHLIWLLVIASSLVFPTVWLTSTPFGVDVPVTTGTGKAALAAAMPFASRGQLVEAVAVPGLENVVSDPRTAVLRRLLPALVAGVWAAGAVFFLLRLLVGRFTVYAVLKRAGTVSLGSGIAGRLSRLAGLRRQVPILLCRDCGIPFTCGILHPVVVLPAGAEAWPRGRLRSVVMHEMAHVQRRECLVNTIAAVVCALLWPLPALWLSYRSMQKEAEKCSDHWVLRQGIRSTDYASALVELVRGSGGAVLAAGAVIPLGRKRFVVERIRELLAARNRDPDRSYRSSAVVLIAGICCLMSVLALAGAVPAGDEALTGSWVTRDDPSPFRFVWTADGRVFNYTGPSVSVLCNVGRYKIEHRWVDREGNAWILLNVTYSPPPYRTQVSWTEHVVTRIDPTGTRLEYNRLYDGSSARVTLLACRILYRES